VVLGKYFAFFFRSQHFLGVTMSDPELRGITIIRNVEKYLCSDTVCHAIGMNLSDAMAELQISNFIFLRNVDKNSSHYTI
jgi:hypothetical protein